MFLQGMRKSTNHVLLANHFPSKCQEGENGELTIRESLPWFVVSRCLEVENLIFHGYSFLATILGVNIAVFSKLGCIFTM